MMYNIHTGYNVPQVPNEEILILVSSLVRIAELQIPFVFTDQHAYPAMANYYTDLGDLGEIDWALLNRRDFQHDPDDPAQEGAIPGGGSRSGSTFRLKPFSGSVAAMQLLMRT